MRIGETCCTVRSEATVGEDPLNKILEHLQTWVAISKKLVTSIGDKNDFWLNGGLSHLEERHYPGKSELQRTEETYQAVRSETKIRKNLID